MLADGELLEDEVTEYKLRLLEASNPKEVMYTREGVNSEQIDYSPNINTLHEPNALSRKLVFIYKVNYERNLFMMMTK